jgi:hypothetical protein
VDTVFLQEKKQYSSAQGVITIRKVGIVRGDSRITISEEVIDSLDDTSIWKLKIYCHFLHFAKTEDIGLKCCMGARFLKTRSTGRKQQALRTGHSVSIIFFSTSPIKLLASSIASWASLGSSKYLEGIPPGSPLG